MTRIERLIDKETFQLDYGGKVILASDAKAIIKAEHAWFRRMVKEFMNGDEKVFKDLKKWDEDKRQVTALVVATRQAFCEHILTRLTQRRG